MVYFIMELVQKLWSHYRVARQCDGGQQQSSIPLILPHPPPSTRPTHRRTTFARVDYTLSAAALASRLRFTLRVSRLLFPTVKVCCSATVSRTCSQREVPWKPHAHYLIVFKVAWQMRKSLMRGEYWHFDSFTTQGNISCCFRSGERKLYLFCIPEASK